MSISKEFRDVAKQFETDIAELESELESANERIEYLNAELDEKGDTISALYGNITSLEEENQILKQELAEAILISNRG